MLLNGAQTGAFTYYLANSGQYMLQNGAQIASSQIFIPSNDLSPNVDKL